MNASIGAITIEEWNRSTPVEPFLKEANAALYRVKGAGRNCVVFADSLVVV